MALLPLAMSGLGRHAELGSTPGACAGGDGDVMPAIRPVLRPLNLDLNAGDRFAEFVGDASGDDTAARKRKVHAL